MTFDIPPKLYALLYAIAHGARGTVELSEKINRTPRTVRLYIQSMRCNKYLRIHLLNALQTRERGEFL